MSRQRKPWTLARSLRLHIVVSATLPLVIAIIVGYSLLLGSLTRELDSLVDEELSEANLRLPDAWQAVRDFGVIADRCQSEHLNFPMAWRIVSGQSGTEVGDFGVVELLDRIDILPKAGSGVVHLDNLMAAKTMTIDGGHVLSLAIDGSVLEASLHSYEIASALTLGFCVLLALIAAGVTAARIRRLFSKVASGVPLETRSELGQTMDDAGSYEELPEEIREVAEQLHAVLQDIRQVADESRVFTMSLAHELRSPVQNLIGQSEVALMRTRDVNSYKETLTAHLDELVNFSDALDNLLTYCTQPHARMERHEQFDLAEEAQIRLRREQQRGGRKQVSVSLSHRGDTNLCGDREAVMRGIRNVVANAVDWSPPGGVVNVEIVGDCAGVHVTVVDSGPGLPIELREKVFEPFFQGPSTGKARIGYGLGLAMTKKVAEFHGGRVVIDDAEAGGARFVIDFGRDL
ncbi:MAG: signal transduction histidine kinase [Planctomycetota bacterium]|jgi:signal transduction histidine kinase